MADDHAEHVSEAAAGLWLCGGLALTAVVQGVTRGESSVTAGLRKHRVLFALITFAFVAHVFEWRPFVRFDPFRLVGQLIARKQHRA